MISTSNKLSARYYGFNFSIEDSRKASSPLAIQTKLSERQWTKEVNLNPSVLQGPRLVFLAKSGKLFAHRGAA